MSINARLLEARKARGLTQRELAARLSKLCEKSIRRTLVGRYERDRSLQIELVPYYAKALGFNLEWLFTGEGPRDNEPHYRICYLAEQLQEKTTQAQRRGIELIFNIKFPLESSSVKEFTLGPEGAENGDTHQ